MVLFQSIVLGGVGLVVLLGLYGAIEQNWPLNYMPARSLADMVGRYSLRSYLVFRLIPPFIVFTATTITAQRLYLSPWTTFFAGAVIYAALPLLLRADNRRPTHRYWLVFAASQLLALSSMLVATLSRSQFSPLVPAPNELLSGLWTAAAAAAGYFAISRFASESGAYNDRMLQERARKDIGATNWVLAKVIADKYGVPTAALRAILIAEATQRPRWFRVLEHAAQTILPGQHQWTTGIAQITSERPLSDSHSIEALAANLKAWMANSEYDTEGELTTALFSEFTATHNALPFYIHTASVAYEALLDDNGEP